MLAQAPRTSLADTAAAGIRTEIASGRWAVGTRIPIESQLAHRLGVSRGTVREAIRTLVHGGLLEVRQGSGTYVLSNVDPSEGLHKLRRASLRDQFELRCALEVEAARLAALRHTAHDLRRLRTLLDQRGSREDAQGGDAALDPEKALAALGPEVGPVQAVEALPPGQGQARIVEGHGVTGVFLERVGDGQQGLDAGGLVDFADADHAALPTRISFGAGWPRKAAGLMEMP